MCSLDRVSCSSERSDLVHIAHLKAVTMWHMHCRVACMLFSRRLIQSQFDLCVYSLLLRLIACVACSRFRRTLLLSTT